MLSVRDYRTEDFAGMHALDQACFPRGIAYTRRELLSLLGMQSAVALVLDGAAGAGTASGASSGVAGFAIAEKTSQRGVAMGHLITIDVEPAMRRGGAGAALLAEMERRLASGGALRMRLEVAENNAAAQSFYLKSGYAFCGRIERYYLGAIDALLMEKSLAEA